MQTLGIIDIIWNGLKIPVEKGTGTYTPGGMQNKTVVAGRQVFRSQEFVPSEAEATTVFRRGDSLLTKIDPNVEGELQVVCDTGQVFMHTDAFIVDKPKITAGDGGKVAIKWNAGEPLELVNPLTAAVTL